MLDFPDLGLEGIERLCPADLSWELVPLYYCPGKEGKVCIVFVCSQLAILMVSSTGTPLQILIFINGNKSVYGRLFKASITNLYAFVVGWLFSQAHFGYH